MIEKGKGGSRKGEYKPDIEVNFILESRVIHHFML